MPSASNPMPAPTDAELDVLGVLWERGPSTVREVHDAIGVGRGVGYTTVLKQMQVMHAKGLLVRSERFRSHVYEAAHARGAMQRQLVGALLRQAFGGSAKALLQSALAGRRVDAKELEEIRRIIDEYQRKAR